MTRAAAPLPRPPGTVRQVAALVGFRIGLLTTAQRRRVRVAAALLPVLVAALVVVGEALPDGDLTGPGALLTPSAWLLFAVTTAVAGLAGTGGRELLPREQRTALPVSPAAEHLTALLLAPLNLGWVVQVLGLTVLTAWVSRGTGGLLAGLAAAALWVVAATCLGQTLGWAAEVLRCWRVGRLAAGAWLLRGGALAAGLWLWSAAGSADEVATLVQTSPVQPLALRAVLLSQGVRVTWNPVLAAELPVLVVGSWVAGVALVRLLARLPPVQQQHGETRRHPVRPDAPSGVAAHLRVDLAGVARSAPLRRGLVAVTVVPAAAAGLTRVDWAIAPLLPGLVVAAAALLFGVNAFAVDGPGALWREGLPGPAADRLVARAAALTLVCLVPAALTAVVAMLRAGAPPGPAGPLAVVVALLGITAGTVTRCLSWSLRRPYAAALRDVRDQPAPPAAMAGYATRLALGTTGAGLALAAGVGVRSCVVVVCTGLVLAALSARRWLGLRRAWADDDVRLPVLAVVAGASTQSRG